MALGPNYASSGTAIPASAPRVPQQDQTVPVDAQFDERRARINPPAFDTDLGAKLFAGVQDVGAKIQNVFQAQQENRDALNGAQLEQQIVPQLTQARMDAIQNGTTAPGLDNNMVSLYRQSGDQILQNVSNDSLYKSMSPAAQARVTASLTRAHTQGIEDTTLQMMHSAVAEQQAQWDTLKATTANTVAADYRVGADGSISDGPNAINQRGKIQQMAETLWGHKPDQMNAEIAAFNQQATLQRAQYIAQSSANSPFLLDKFMKAQPTGTFTADQVQHFSALQTEAIRAPYTQTLATEDAQKAQAIAQLNQMQSSNDPNLSAQAYQEKLLGHIDEGQYYSFTGSVFAGPKVPSDGTLLSNYKSDITNNPFKYSAADIAAIPTATIGTSGLTAEDRRQLQALRYDSAKSAQKPLNQAYQDARTMIRETLTPKTVVNPAAAKLRVDGGLSDLESAWKGGQLQTPSDVLDFRDRIIKSWMGTRKAPEPMPHVKFAPTGIAPGVAAKIASDARAAAFDGGGEE